jgi:class 3 adenylate cyclase
MHVRELTFLFTDIEGSTAMWERDPEVMARLLARHDRHLYRAIHLSGGRVFAAGGDGVAAAFGHPSDAMRAALDVRSAMQTLGLSVRVGLHQGNAIERHGNFVGPTVNRAARIMRSAGGGQVLASATVVASAHRVCGIDVIDAGLRDLPGVPDAMQVFELSRARDDVDASCERHRVRFAPCRPSAVTSRS